MTPLERRLWRFSRRHADYKAAFSSPEGMRVLADLRRFCLVDDTMHGGGTEQTHVNIGQRNVFLHIQRCMKVDPEKLAQLTQEAESE